MGSRREVDFKNNIILHRSAAFRIQLFHQFKKRNLKRIDKKRAILYSLIFSQRVHLPCPLAAPATFNGCAPPAFGTISLTAQGLMLHFSV